MARYRADLSVLDDIAKKLKSAGKFDDPIKKEILKAGEDVAVKAWKEEIIKQGHVDTGDMLDSVKGRITGNQADIYPHGKDRKGVRNGEKAFVLHYGRKNMLGSRFVDNIERKIEAEAPAAMQEVFFKYLEKEGLL